MAQILLIIILCNGKQCQAQQMHTIFQVVSLNKSTSILIQTAKLVSKILKNLKLNGYCLNQNILPLSLHGLKILRDHYTGLSGKLQVIKPL